MYLETLLVLGLSAEGIAFKKQTTLRSDTGLKLLTAQIAGNCKILKFYYGTLVYTVVSKERHRNKIYGERVMQVSAGSCRK